MVYNDRYIEHETREQKHSCKGLGNGKCEVLHSEQHWQNHPFRGGLGNLDRSLYPHPEHEGFTFLRGLIMTKQKSIVISVEVYDLMILAISGAIAYIDHPDLYNKYEVLKDLLNTEVALETGKIPEGA